MVVTNIVMMLMKLIRLLQKNIFSLIPPVLLNDLVKMASICDGA
jgi:hypothetical protein